MKKFALITVFLFLCLACQTTSKQVNDLLLSTKKLEYSREESIQKWQNLYSSAKTTDTQDIVLQSMANCKNESLIIFYKKILLSSANKVLKSKAIFALGQTKSDSAENILLLYATTDKSQNVSILKALAQCGSSKSDLFLSSLLKNNSLLDPLFETAGILSKKKIELPSFNQALSDSFFIQHASPKVAYFLMNSSSFHNRTFLIDNLAQKDSLSQKYLLRALNKNINPAQNNDTTGINDTLRQILRLRLKDILSRRLDWRINYYALNLFSNVADSSDLTFIRSFTQSSIPYIRVLATQITSKISGNKSIRNLLNAFDTEQSYYQKGKILIQTAKLDPKSAFRYIMNNLDKGPTSFKEDLLSALSSIPTQLSANTLRSFLSVQNVRLVNKAFALLSSSNQIRSQDIKMLFQTTSNSVLYSVLEWQLNHKTVVDKNLLFDAFKRFSDPDHFETQEQVIKILAKSEYSLSREDLLFLSQYACNKVVLKLLNQTFNIDASREFAGAATPNFLRTDSVLAIYDKNILATIHTPKGDISIKLNTHDTPLTSFNFIHLANMNFYNNLIFHRVIPDFVIQGGDPMGDGSGGSGYTIPSEDGRPFLRGSVGIATAGFDTGGCQFFICQSEQPHLNGNYTAFGRVIKGMDIVDKITIDDQINSVTILFHN